MWEVKGAVAELPCEIGAGEVGVEAGYLRTLLHGEPKAEAAEVAVACLPEVEVALPRGEGEAAAWWLCGVAVGGHHSCRGQEAATACCVVTAALALVRRAVVAVRVYGDEAAATPPVLEGVVWRRPADE